MGGGGRGEDERKQWLLVYNPVPRLFLQSNADVIAHEIAHSWTGNLVTNKSFEHFWLNEGFTVFVERKIQESEAVTQTDKKNLFFFTVSFLGSRPFHCVSDLESQINPDPCGVSHP